MRSHCSVYMALSPAGQFWPTGRVSETPVIDPCNIRPRLICFTGWSICFSGLSHREDTEDEGRRTPGTQHLQPLQPKLTGEWWKWDVSTALAKDNLVSPPSPHRWTKYPIQSTYYDFQGKAEPTGCGGWEDSASAGTVSRSASQPQIQPQLKPEQAPAPYRTPAGE